MEAKLLYRHNVISLNSINSFVNIRGGYNNNLRDVYFVRVIGESTDLVKTIETMDRILENEMDRKRLNYLRISSLPQMREISDSNYYTKCYDDWKKGTEIKLKNLEMHQFFKQTLENAIENTISLFIDSKKNISDTIVRNYTVKLFFWLDSIGKDLFLQWDERMCIKVVADNVMKEQEYLFFQMLTYLGCDVMLIQNRGDIVLTDQEKKYCCEIQLGEFGKTKIKEYNRTQTDSKDERTVRIKSNDSRTGEDVLPKRVVIPERVRKKPSPKKQLNYSAELKENAESERNQKVNNEKSFEELAQLASSIVLIAIHDNNGEIIGTGSGIMIGKNGYILTNNHVASGGRFYSVRIEEDDTVYTTNEVIKYNSVTDLAVIRINRQLKPIPIYRGRNKLARGQKVVAIGSPLGLFNSVSDGIISGFRRIDDVNMIQFTAPISHGSSGGAVINMQGEVIGISTAGIDNGQNINLAIGYENILMFAKGFY